jgi:hypothetical protein
MELIDLVLMKNATKETVAVCLETAVSKTGVPRALLDDHGADLHGAAEIFIGCHLQTIELYDIKHKAACLLKAQLEKDPRWKLFASELGQAKFATQQTELALLTPPSQRPKARFMNLRAQSTVQPGGPWELSQVRRWLIPTVTETATLLVPSRSHGMFC